MRIEKLERDLLWSVLGDEFKKFGIFQPIFIGVNSFGVLPWRKMLFGGI